ncbi:potassium transporter [Thelephora ganbajun]|uniref:Potassium transporter n=1 Tax=Thelephora ganbajun TaxID=370292 RepID=A0ACB6Z3L7_THEGA|nr:potassium transporter [Thelephora ganbajun]
MDSRVVPDSFEKPVTQPRKPHVARGWGLLSLSFSTLGIVYADIGTSPLYTLNGIWAPDAPAPPKEDVIGGISATIWAMTLLPLVKYVFICLHFGTGEGEGGSFALFQGLYPPSRQDTDSDRVLTGDSTSDKTKSVSGSGHIPNRFRWPLFIWCLFATGLTMADGVLTPAVSVTSAAGGIAVAQPSTANSVIGISLAFLVPFFLVQPFGTGKLSFMFAPIAFIWLLLIGATGIVNIVTVPGIFRAFDPSRAILWFVRTKNYDNLTGVVLALTGCEAMFANLGQYNKLSIQISFSVFVYPCLILAYLGQGARIIKDGDAVMNNIFYATIPGSSNGPLFWIIYVFGIFATLIASQTMVTATFSLIQQIVNMKSLPPLRLKHASDSIQGRIYIPIVNWILMITIVIIVVAFKNSNNLTNAYGFAVATVMFSTSTIIAVQMFYVKHWPIIVALVFFLFFGFFDGLFWGASLRKVPHGAWVPLMLAFVMMLFMLFWTWGKRLEDRFDGANRQNLRHVILAGEKGEVAIPVNEHLHAITSENDKLDESETVQERYYYFTRDQTAGDSIQEQPEDDRGKLIRTPTCAVFYKFAPGKGVPHSFVRFIRQWPALPQVVIFVSVCVLPVARVPVDQRYSVDKVRSIKGFYGVTYYLGFREDFEVKIDEVIEKICLLESFGNHRESSVTIQEIRRAAFRATHVIPYYHVVSKVELREDGLIRLPFNWIRRFLIESIYRRLIISFPETAKWTGPADEIIRVGITARI